MAKGEESTGHTRSSGGRTPEMKYSLTWDKVQFEGPLIEVCYDVYINTRTKSK
jgi:hypothetical protein